MAKKENRIRKAKPEISRIQQATGTTRKTAIRKMRAAAKARPKAKAQKNPKSATTRTQPMQKGVVSQNRSEGIPLFKLAGRPSKKQFILVYGERGPRMTWGERAKAGVPAEKFQGALTSAVRGRN